MIHMKKLRRCQFEGKEKIEVVTDAAATQALQF